MVVSEELYSRILRVMPIPCVDLLVVDDADSVLLLRRRNDPAAGQWWFPGGRVFFGELRRDAAKRKLEEECGLSSREFEEMGTFDLLLDSGPKQCSHAITTFFRVQIPSGHNIRLDSQSSEASWLSPREWLERELHPFVRNGLSVIVADATTSQSG